MLPKPFHPLCPVVVSNTLANMLCDSLGCFPLPKCHASLFFCVTASVCKSPLLVPIRLYPTAAVLALLPRGAQQPGRREQVLNQGCFWSLDLMRHQGLEVQA
jgi:hypothetical protein